MLTAHAGSPPLVAPAGGHGDNWQARLQLQFARRDSGSYLARRAQLGPLGLQKILYPEGPQVAHAIVLHPPGGIAGGDQLHIEVDVGVGAHALLTTPGASKWYRSHGRQAQQHVQLNVATDGVLEWLPQENIVFDQAIGHSHTRVQLQRGARLLAWEVTALGRPAAELHFAGGRFHQSWHIEQEGRLLWWEQGAIAGGDVRLAARPGLHGRTVMGTLVAAGVRPDADLLEQLRTLPASLASPALLTGVTVTGRGVLLCRCLSDGSESARHWLAQAWAVLRPAMLQRPAVTPRIWNT